MREVTNMEFLARTCKTEQMNVQRILARSLVLLGAVSLFWMTFGASYTYQGSPLAFAAGYAMMFTAGVLLVFVVSMFYENLAAAILILGAVALVVWGVVASWGAGSWGIMAFLFLFPMIISAALYAAAARMQKVCEMK